MATCRGTTKKGTACKGSPVSRDVGDPGYCMAHQPDEVRADVGFGGTQSGSGRPRVPRATELARRIVEEQAHELLRPYLKALGLDIDEAGHITRGLTGAVHVGRDTEGGVFASNVEDLGAQIAAAEKLMDRVLGKPRQALEHTGEGGGPIEVDDAKLDLKLLTDEELDQLQGIYKRVRDRKATEQS